MKKILWIVTLSLLLFHMPVSATEVFTFNESIVGGASIVKNVSIHCEDCNYISEINYNVLPNATGIEVNYTSYKQGDYIYVTVYINFSIFIIPGNYEIQLEVICDKDQPSSDPEVPEEEEEHTTSEGTSSGSYVPDIIPEENETVEPEEVPEEEEEEEEPIPTTGNVKEAVGFPYIILPFIFIGILCIGVLIYFVRKNKKGENKT